MTEQEIYDLWAPLDVPWSPWAKPVLFTQLERAIAGSGTMLAGRIAWPGAPDLAAQRLALILDLPGEQATAIGLQLVAAGYRPVPLFNTSHGFNAVVPTQDIITALSRGGELLAQTQLPPQAPPVFLLDADRMREHGGVLPGKYDNRWLVFPQDFPSASFLKSQQIAGAVLVQSQQFRPQADLAHVLLRWQEAGLPLLSINLREGLVTEVLRVERPSRYRTLWYHFLAVVGLRRNSAGGFGAVVPEPSQGGGFG